MGTSVFLQNEWRKERDEEYEKELCRRQACGEGGGLSGCPTVVGEESH